MKSFLKSLVCASIFFGATFAQDWCRIYARDEEYTVVTYAGSSAVSVAQDSGTNSYWYIPAVGTPGPITHINTGKITFISEGKVLAEPNAQPQNWNISDAGDGEFTIQAADQNSYWTDRDTINVEGKADIDLQKFTFFCH